MIDPLLDYKVAQTIITKLCSLNYKVAQKKLRSFAKSQSCAQHLVDKKIKTRRNQLSKDFAVTVS